MSNPYYTPTGAPSTKAAGSSATMRAQFNAIEDGFDLLPTLSGNALKLVRVNAAATALEAAASGTFDMNGNAIILDADDDTTITADTDDRIDMSAGGFDVFRVDGTIASTVNGLDVRGGATGDPASIRARGETNVDIDLVPAGTGVVKFNGAVAAGNYGLVLSNGSTPNTDIDVSAGQCWTIGRGFYMAGAAMTKELDSTWAVGDATGFLDAGSPATSTGYYAYAIRKDSDGSVDYIASTSKTWAGVTKTLISGYTYAEKIGYFFTDSSGNIKPFTQTGDSFASHTTTTISTDSTITDGAFETITNFAAPAYSEASILVKGDDTGSSSGAAYTNIRRTGKTGGGNTVFTYSANTASAMDGIAGRGVVILDENAAFDAAMFESSNATLTITAISFRMTDRFNCAS